MPARAPTCPNSRRSPACGTTAKRPTPTLGALAAPPYDVVDDDQRAALEAADEHNSVRLILPRDVAREGDRYDARGRDVRAAGAQPGVLVADTAPRFYAYRMTFTDPHGGRRHTRGVLGALTLPEPGADDVLPHERTLPKAKSDRLALLRAMRVNVDPIWGLSLAPGLTTLLDVGRPARALPRHRRRATTSSARSTTPRPSPRSPSVVGSSALVLADGHHRFETALQLPQRATARRDPSAARTRS